MFEEMTVAKMYNLNETIAKDIFEGVTYPWEVRQCITVYILAVVYQKLCLLLDHCLIIFQSSLCLTTSCQAYDCGHHQAEQ